MNRKATFAALCLFLAALCGCGEDYQAQVILKVRASPAAPGASLDDLPAPNAEFVRGEAAILTSLSTIRAAVERSRIHQWRIFDNQTPDQVARELKERITATVYDGTGLITLTVRLPEREYVDRLANYLAETFVERESERLRSPVDNDHHPLLLKRLAIDRMKEEELTAELADLTAVFGPKAFLRLKLDTLRHTVIRTAGRRDEIDLDLVGLEPRVARIRQALADGGAGIESLFEDPALLTAPELRRLATDLALASSRLAALQVNLAPGHFEVQQAQQEIEDLRTQIALTRKTFLLDQKATYDQLESERKLILAKIEEDQAEYLALEDRLRQFERATEDLRRTREAIEQCAAEISKVEARAAAARAPVEILSPAVRPRRRP
jgi:anion-transporting  ArsA/GET3 family ATPase